MHRKFVPRTAVAVAFRLFALLVPIATPAADTGPAPPAVTVHFPVTEFGVIGDGTTLNTSAIQKAIDAAAAAGGGRVEIPRQSAEGVRP